MTRYLDSQLCRAAFHGTAAQEKVEVQVTLGARGQEEQSRTRHVEAVEKAELLGRILQDGQPKSVSQHVQELPSGPTDQGLSSFAQPQKGTDSDPQASRCCLHRPRSPPAFVEPGSPSSEAAHKAPDWAKASEDLA